MHSLQLKMTYPSETSGISEMLNKSLSVTGYLIVNGEIT